MTRDPDQPKETRRKTGGSGAIGGGLWTVLERVLSQGTQLVIFVVAARLLSPAEFGVFALVSACAILMLRVSEASWAPYIMSWAGDAKVPRQVVMVSIWSGLALAAAGALGALMLPLLGVDVATSHLVVLFSGWVFLATVSSAQKGMLIWQGGLRASALCEILGDLIGMAVAVAALYAGWGVFALAFGRLAFQATHLTLSFGFTRAAPMRGMRGAALADLWAYTRQSFTARMIANVRLYVATFLIGGFLGPAAVGYYRAAQRLVGSVAEIIGQPALLLAWNLFRRARDAASGTAGFQAVARVFFPALVAISGPVFIWLVLMGEDLIEGLLGPKWLPALPVVAVLALSRGVVSLGVATEPVLSLAGEIRRLPLFSLLFLIATVALTLLAAPFGLMAVAWAQVAVAAVMVGASMFLIQRHGGIDWVDVGTVAWRLIAPMLAGAAMLLWVRDWTIFAGAPPLVRAFAVLVPTAPAYLLALTLALPGLRSQARARLARLRRPVLGA
ncbi:oligosaccharide flippase family protein [Allgaiera indica]|uniref:Membrane protein involved in the export of O-antigen and teichoic acid n=1 Tax=Allgaiera indica TaxID=765699 RepID=A0A1H2YCX8_9RHOB|nr:oligosaccharide flippase family protein [Allgaiera indica]SDX03017.1 Membrane protein involved in the export of O-antigen and teichoic acid [Allgaiera indica]